MSLGLPHFPQEPEGWREAATQLLEAAQKVWDRRGASVSGGAARKFKTTLTQVARCVVLRGGVWCGGGGWCSVGLELGVMWYRAGVGAV